MFRFAENSRCRENEIPAFAGMEILLIDAASHLPFPLPFPFPRKRESFPASAGNSAKRKPMSPVGDAWRTMPPREIPAFAGMEILLIDAVSHLPFRRKPESLRRSRIRRQATIAMFRFAENSRCRENEIPAFAGMEILGNSFLQAARLRQVVLRTAGLGYNRRRYGKND